MAIEIDPALLSTKQKRLTEILAELQTPAVVSDYKKAGELNKELIDLQDFLDTHSKYTALSKQLTDTEILTSDPEMAEAAAAELPLLQEQIQQLESKLKDLTALKLPDDERPAIVEIRAGTGGTEAALFAEEVHRMYVRYLNTQHMDIESIHTSLEDTGGIKEVVFRVDEKGAFGKLRFESGVHRVQRVPVTEANGRIHTSAISVVILPEIPESDVNIPASDIRVDVYRSSGAGGQGVNRTDSAVRITHLPTGIIVTCQDSRSQHKNKEKAMSILASKLYTAHQQEVASKTKDIRSQAIQSGDRSAKIRTYNFPQGRITDHRISKSWFNIQEVLEGELDEIVKTVNKELRDRISQGQVITAEDAD
ncbi:MAG: peptide chain release factor 1 [Candidatus Doudnabacteria bacterium]|nr:peptide chain release factor 1 [Candidatus Doudnabacteria bacterium]